jgi:Matrixin
MNSPVMLICFLLSSMTILSLSFVFPVNLDSEAHTIIQGKEKSIGICCSWREQIEDGKLTYTISGTDLKTRNTIVSVIEEWDSKLEPLEIEQVKGDNSADIYIGFKADGKSLLGQQMKHGSLPGGVTIHRIDRYGFIQDVHIIIAEGVLGHEFSRKEIKLVAEHEIGHALGLGHANFRSSIMSAKVNSQQFGSISDCEINSVIFANAWKLRDGNSDQIAVVDGKVTC